MIYDSARHYSGFLNALSNTGLFTVSQENGAIVLTPKSPTTLAAFSQYVAAMKDSSKVVVTGIEVIETADNRVVNSGNLVINQFKLLAAKQFGLSAVNFAIPQQYLGEPPDEDAIIGYIQKNIAAFPARFLAICVTETHLESGIPEYKIPPSITAQTQFLLYDLITDERIDSETAAPNAAGRERVAETGFVPECPLDHTPNAETHSRHTRRAGYAQRKNAVQVDEFRRVDAGKAMRKINVVIAPPLDQSIKMIYSFLENKIFF